MTLFASTVVLGLSVFHLCRAHRRADEHRPECTGQCVPHSTRTRACYPVRRPPCTVAPGTLSGPSRRDLVPTGLVLSGMLRPPGSTYVCRKKHVLVLVILRRTSTQTTFYSWRSGICLPSPLFFLFVVVFLSFLFFAEVETVPDVLSVTVAPVA